MGWPDTATAITALRNILADGPTDKYAALKKVFGAVDGVNLNFKTFEYRRLTDFTAPTGSLGVFKNGALITPTSDDPAFGQFILNESDVPSNRDAIAASYYYQWFLDAELDSFLQNACTWLGFGATYINLDDGLNAAALRFACQDAYEYLAAKYATRAAEIYKLEDTPSEDILKSVQAFQAMADNFMDKASKLRDDFYTRQGQSLAPNFSFALGNVVDPTPRK